MSKLYLPQLFAKYMLARLNSRQICISKLALYLQFLDMWCNKNSVPLLSYNRDESLEIPQRLPHYWRCTSTTSKGTTKSWVTGYLHSSFSRQTQHEIKKTYNAFIFCVKLIHLMVHFSVACTKWFYFSFWSIYFSSHFFIWLFH